jgi:hypothetical protein
VRPCDEAGCQQPGKWWAETGFLCDHHYHIWWDHQIGLGALCMEYWGEKPCRNQPDGDKAVLCQFHGAMADASQRAYYKRARGGSTSHQGSGGHGVPVSERLSRDA